MGPIFVDVNHSRSQYLAELSSHLDRIDEKCSGEDGEIAFRSAVVIKASSVAEPDRFIDPSLDKPRIFARRFFGRNL